MRLNWKLIGTISTVAINALSLAYDMIKEKQNDEIIDKKIEEALDRRFSKEEGES